LYTDKLIAQHFPAKLRVNSSELSISTWMLCTTWGFVD
jgi:hypothetical protein